MKRLGIAVSLVVCCLSAAADARSLSRTVSSGKTQQVLSYASWGEACSPRAGTVRLVTKPQHGKVQSRRSNLLITTARFGDTKCIGKRIPGVAIDYTPDKGFRGTDSFVVNVKYHTHLPEDDTLTLTVE